MKGQCLCAAVSIDSPDAREIGVFHCDSCRRWGGGPLLTVHCGSDLDVIGAHNVAIYASSEWAERAFCRQCGTHLYYRLLATGEYFVPAGVFDSNDFELASQIYIDRKPDYYEFANQTPMLTEQQVIDQYASSGEANSS